MERATTKYAERVAAAAVPEDTALMWTAGLSIYVYSVASMPSVGKCLEQDGLVRMVTMEKTQMPGEVARAAAVAEGHLEGMVVA